MLTREENALITQVGPDAPMGKMMRRYWIPAALSGELEAGGAPRRVRLLGENLVAFRTPEGRVGLLDENCPHRGASLVLARNEECGLRCLYHGWKIEPSGRILETPPEPDELGFKDKVRAISYPVHEAGGIIWTYMGPPGLEPPKMSFPWTVLPDNHTLILKSREECNWLQCLEGVIDSAHSNFLHSNSIRPKGGHGSTLYRDDAYLDRPSNDGAPHIEAQNTAYGFRYAAIRKPIVDPDKQRYIRVTLFVAPFYAMFPAPDGWGFAQAFVPIDDEHAMFHYIQWSLEGPIDERKRALHAERAGLRPGVDLDAEFRKIRTRENQWMQDRAAMREGSFTGLFGVNLEDIAVQESMGQVYDRSKEHLGTSDVAVIRVRRMLLDSLKEFTETGAPPLGLREPVPYEKLRAEEKMIPIGAAWQPVGAFAGEPVEA